MAAHAGLSGLSHHRLACPLAHAVQEKLRPSPHSCRSFQNSVSISTSASANASTSVSRTRLNSFDFLVRTLSLKDNKKHPTLQTGAIYRTVQCAVDFTNDTAKCEENKKGVLKSTLKASRALSISLVVLGMVMMSLRASAMAASSSSQAGGSTGVVSTIQKIPPVSELLMSGWAGLTAGCLHALTGPDHLAALAPLCIGRAKLESAAVGVLWGFGHDTGQVLVGLAFLLLKEKLHIELLQTWAARVVGMTLLGIGLIGIKEAQEAPITVPSDSPKPAEESQKRSHRLRTFATGIVYGLQPDALIMILPALALPSRFAGAAYLCMFLIGTAIAMGSYTAFIGSCGEALQKRLPWITRRLSLGSSCIAMAFGLGILAGEIFGINIF